MPEISKLSLNAGELSDELAGRIDLSKFNSGCEILENARVLRAGGVTRRAGFEYIADTLPTTAFTTDASRLVGFRFDAGEGYIIELSHLKMRVLYQGAVVASTSTGITTPWETSQLFDLQFAQRIDRIVVTHPSVPVYNIIRHADASWTVSELPWVERIWETYPSTTEFLLTPSALTGTGINITSNNALFDASWEGQRIKIDHTVSESLTEYSVAEALSPAASFNPATGYPLGAEVFHNSGGINNYFTCIGAYTGSTSSEVDPNHTDYAAYFEEGVPLVGEVVIEKGWVFETFGTWEGTYKVQRSYNSGVTWNTIKIITSDDNRNERVTDLEIQDALIRVVVTRFETSVPAGINTQFTVSTHTRSGSAIITGLTNATSVVATVEKDFHALTTGTGWYEEALSPRNGYPNGVTFHQGRLCLAGTSSRPQTLWLSRTQKPFDFTFGSLATDGMSFQTDAEGYESIVWLSSHLSLLVGTTLGVWAVSAPDGSSISPENNGLNRQMQLGSEAGFQAVPLQNNVLFLQKNGRKVQELTGGSVEYGGYKSADLTQLATQVTRGGIKQLAAGGSPDSSLFMVNGDDIAMLTYERSQNVVGWSRITTGGPAYPGHKIVSFATTSGDAEDDHYYAVVNRGGFHYIERMAPDMLRVEEDNDVANLRFLDSFTEVSAPGTTQVTGLGRLNGMTVDTFIDGEPAGSVDVANGIAVLPQTGTNVVVGLPYTTTIRPMSVDFGAIASKSAINEILIRFRNTLGGEVSQDGENWSKVEQVQPVILTDTPLSLLSSDYQATPHSSWGRKTSISVRQTQPLPMTILAMRLKTKTSK